MGCQGIMQNVQMGEKLTKNLNAQPPRGGSGVCVMLLGFFCWHGLSPLVPLGGRVTENFKFVVCYHLQSVMKHFYAKGRVLLKDASIKGNRMI